MVRQESVRQIPTEPDFLRSVKEKFEQDALPVLRENERWIQRSRRLDIKTCLSGEFPKS